MVQQEVNMAQSEDATEEKMAEAVKQLSLEAAKETARDESGKLAEPILALPQPAAGLAGSSSAAGKNFNVTVSNKAGYLCHVHVVADWPVPPEVPFAIFTHPDNSALFRDIKRVGTRKVLKMEPGYKEVQVEQLGEVQLLWIHRTYSTWLHVTEDARDPECLRTIFCLEKSDVLAKFNGEWELRPVRDPTSGRIVGCHGELHQDVLPKGMPAFMAHVPLLGGALRGVSVRAVKRVMEDFNVALDKVLAGHAAGRSTEAVLRELCGPISEAAHANGAVTSFAFDPADDDDEEEVREEEQEADAEPKAKDSTAMAPSANNDTVENSGSSGGDATAATFADASAVGGACRPQSSGCDLGSANSGDGAAAAASAKGADNGGTAEAESCAEQPVVISMSADQALAGSAAAVHVVAEAVTCPEGGVSQ